MSDASKLVSFSSLKLGITVLVAIAILTLAYQLTRDRIAEQQRRAELRGIMEILPADIYDNDILADVIPVQSELLGDSPESNRPAALENRKIYRARKNGQPVAAVMQVTAPGGYNGNIELLVGVLLDGRLSGVRVTSHKETPGLGDGIELRVSEWVLAFTGKSLGQPPADRWKVERDGGDFDQFTGATITPRATVAAVRKSLEYFAAQRDILFTETGDSTPSQESDPDGNTNG